MLYLYPTRIAGVGHHIHELLLEFPANRVGKVRTHSIITFVYHVKSNMIISYSSFSNELLCMSALFIIITECLTFALDLFSQN